MRSEVGLPEQLRRLRRGLLRLTHSRAAPTFDALGYVFSVASEDASLQADAEALLDGLSAPSGDRPVTRQGLALPPGGRSAEVLSALVGSVNFAAIVAARGQLLPHAGAVARADGSVTLLCAPAGGGKSTLTLALVRRGRSYVTDETVSIDPRSMRVTPFRKPLALKTGAQQLHPELRPSWWAPGDGPWMVAAQGVGGPPLPDAVLVPELLVFPRYEPGADVRLEPVEPGEAAYLVGQQTSRLRDVDGGPLPALARLARRTTAWRLVHGDAEAAADRLLQLWDAA